MRFIQFPVFGTKSLKLASALLIFSTLAACTQAPKQNDERTPSNMGGVDYFRGTFTCADLAKGLESTFTFRESTANFVLKGESIALDCSPAGEADPQAAELFRNQYKQFADICTGKSKKGQVYTATSNSMGAVQMTAFLVANGKEPVKALLNCKSSVKKSEDGW